MEKTNYTLKYKLVGNFIIGFLVSILTLFFVFFMQKIYFDRTVYSISYIIIPFLGGLISTVFALFRKKSSPEQREIINNLEDNINVLLDVNRALMSSIDLSVVLQTIIDKSTYLINLDTGAIYLYSDEKLFLGATTPPLPADFPEFLRHDVLANHPNIQQSLKSQKPVVIEDVSKVKLSDAEQAVVQARNLRSILYIPLIIDKRPVGVMILGTTTNVRHFSSYEIDLYMTFTGQAALSIENAKLHTDALAMNEELSQSNEELIAMNEKLKETNARIEEMMEELTISKIKAEENDRLKTAFLQNISHEIRTPLNAICGFSERINMPDLSNEKRKHFSDIIRVSSHQLLSIVTDILTISTVETGQETLNISRFNINKLLDDLKDVFYQKAVEKNIDLKVFKSFEDTSAEIFADKTKLGQIITNLLSNAIKFTHAGTVEVGYKVLQDNIEFFVKDTGIGIENEKLTVIFNRFIQANESIHVEYGGLGLGLSICRGFVDLMNGRIWVESEQGRGSVFYFTMPYNPVKENEVTNEILTVQKNNVTVLVAEDEEFNMLYLNELLSDFGCTVLHARNGVDALEICQTNKNISFVLMDIMMPLMDGYSATMEIKKLRPELPVIAQTAYALENEKQKYSDVFDEYLSKPILSDTMAKLLNKIFDANTE